jgi:arylformamidase
MARYVWLSFPLGLDDPRPPAIPRPELEPFLTVKNDGANVQTLRVASHTGTHVDAPCHVVDGAVQITEYAPDELIFARPVVIPMHFNDEAVVRPVDLEPFRKALASADIALFRFGWGEVRKIQPDRFSLKSPGFGVEAARWLRESFPDLRAIGMDVPSLACIAHLDETMAAHNVLLEGDGNRFLVIEDMDLAPDLAGLREVRVSPWLVTGMDSGPCSIVGVIH